MTSGLLGMKDRERLEGRIVALLDGLCAYEAVEVLGSVQRKVLESTTFKAPAPNDVLHHLDGKTLAEIMREMDNAHGAVLAGAIVDIGPAHRRAALSVIPKAGKS